MAKLSVILEDPSLAAGLKDAGADEVLIIPKGLSFHAAASFSEEGTEQLIHTVHQNGMQAGVIADRLFGEDEIEEAGRKLQRLLDCADSVQIADPGLIRFAAGNMGKLVFRPAALITNSRDASWWMGRGFGSVYVSPLLTYEETEVIVKSVKGLSLCVHGRQLMSVSARKLLTAYGTVIGKKLPEAVLLREEKREGMMPVFENAYSTTVWTDYILHSFLLLPRIRSEIGRCEINSLLIDEEQLLETVRIYRGLLDGKDPDTDAYLEKYRGQPLEEGYYTQKTIR